MAVTDETSIINTGVQQRIWVALDSSARGKSSILTENLMNKEPVTKLMSKNYITREQGR
jgi:hypothetical protein